MLAKIVKIGEELALTLPREAVKMLGLAEGQPVHVTRLSDGGYRIGAHDPAHDKVMRIAEKAMEDYAETLRALAKS